MNTRKIIEGFSEAELAVAFGWIFYCCSFLTEFEKPVARRKLTNVAAPSLKVFKGSLEGIKTVHLNTMKLFLPMLMQHTNYIMKKFPETSRTGLLQSK